MLYVAEGNSSRSRILEIIHSSSEGGHISFHGTYHKAKSHFYWPGIEKAVKEFVTNCDTCQRNKSENTLLAGLLQPLPIPEQAW